jgi:superfamily II RNA helicase|uniref:Helicase ATP-binding domain-containing protein n=1 Tax=viral metagenome TaxID=1070528 RepID=A0A6C0IM63_9ZZZZ
MVVQLTNETYTPEGTSEYKKYFDKFSFPLSAFQKFAIEAIVTGNHTLSCVPTGSGKTLPALFAIDFFTSQEPKKKVIYTSPIKALSNQKYYEFTQKFPHLSIGLLTGDIKINPEADVLIMTAEILQNTLYKKTQLSEQHGNVNPLLMFDIDFDNELACVIQDEVHMINDADRGHVWENTILMLPRHIQMVMLSATLDDPTKFARWIETRGDDITSTSDNKQVYLATSSYRPVPLTHYSFITAPSALFKCVRDKSEQERIRRQLNTPHVIQDAKGKFDEVKYHELKKIIGIINDNKVFVKRSFILNEVCKYMFENSMLPAVCFILSKRQIAEAAKEVSVPLLEDDSKVPYTVARECEQLLRSKIPNYQEYLTLPEYVEMVKLLEKGIAIHHSGVMPIIREIVEMMFEKGYVKLLFATETFSVGLNMPIKTVLFTDVKKFDGNLRRMLLSHEFVQASGRAGRRGIDTVGNVIHLTNLFRDIDLTNYRTMMHGKPQTLVSKFRVSYNLVFNLIASSLQSSTEATGQTKCLEFCNKSMIQHEISSQVSEYNKRIEHEKNELQRTNTALQSIRTPVDIITTYGELKEKLNTSKNKVRKQLERDIKNIEDTHRYLKTDMTTVFRLKERETLIETLERDSVNTSQFLQQTTQILIDKFYEENFIQDITDNTNQLVTKKGVYATNIREVPCMVFSEVIMTDSFRQLNTEEFIALASCFTGIKVPEDNRQIMPPSDIPEHLKVCIQDAVRYSEHYMDFENLHKISTGTEYELTYDIIHYVMKWCNASSQEECKLVLQDLENNEIISTGEFVKALIKITNIASELERTCEFVGDIALKEMLSKVPTMVLKYIATNQSLYV